MTMTGSEETSLTVGDDTVEKIQKKCHFSKFEVKKITNLQECPTPMKLNFLPGRCAFF